MRDVSLAIHNGTVATFPTIKLGTCFFHAKKAVVTNKEKIVKASNLDKFCDDMEDVQSFSENDVLRSH